MQTIMIVEDDPDIRDGVRIALDCNRVWVDEQEADLTETEYKILKLLMQSPQRIFPVQVIYETVWGEPYFLDQTIPCTSLTAPGPLQKGQCASVVLSVIGTFLWIGAQWLPLNR